MYDYTLVRSKRKTIVLRVLPDATVEIRAPLKTPKDYIDRFCSSKEAWIEKGLLIVRNRQKKMAAFSLNYGDKVFFRGSEYPIAAGTGNRTDFDGECFYIPPGLNTEQIKCACIQNYRMLAKQLLISKTAEFAGKIGVVPAAVKINNAKTRWGSCSERGNINYSWRLVMADDDVIDYVVVHELAHLKELNHSVRFWAVVESAMPEYKERRKRLRLLHKRLDEEDWE